MKATRYLPTLLFLLGVCLVFAGCVPDPQRIYVFPETHGILVSGSAPVAHAELLINPHGGHQDAPCKGALVVGTTNERGEFSVPEQSKLQIWHSPGNPPSVVSQLTSLCFRVNGSEEFLGNQVITRIDRHAHLALHCDLTSPGVPSPALGLMQICEQLDSTPTLQRIR
jgi:hypothetical protein